MVVCVYPLPRPGRCLRASLPPPQVCLSQNVESAGVSLDFLWRVFFSGANIRRAPAHALHYDSLADNGSNRAARSVPGHASCLLTDVVWCGVIYFVRARPTVGITAGIKTVCVKTEVTFVVTFCRCDGEVCVCVRVKERVLLLMVFYTSLTLKLEHRSMKQTCSTLWAMGKIAA